MLLFFIHCCFGSNTYSFKDANDDYNIIGSIKTYIKHEKTVPQIDAKNLQ